MKCKKKFLGVALAVSMLATNVYTPQQIEAKSKVPIVKSSITLTVGQKKTIKVSGTNVKSKKFKVISGKKYVTVNSKGVVKAKKKGTSKIQVTVKYKVSRKVKSKKLNVKVKVLNKSVNTTSTNKPVITDIPVEPTKAPSIVTDKPNNVSFEPSKTPEVGTSSPSERPTIEPTNTPTKEPTNTPSTEIEWGEPVYKWSEDNSSCTATSINKKDSTITKTEEATVTSTVTKEATCEDGIIEYKAEFKSNIFTTQTKDSIIPAVAEHSPHDGCCSVCGIRIAGLYDKDGSLLRTLKASDVEKDYTSSTYKTSTKSLYYVIKNYNPSTTKVVIPDGVTSIGSYAFSDCKGLTSIIIPDSVTSIGDDAFRKCSGLTSITIPDGVTTIGDWAFGYCVGLTSIIIPSSVTSIGDYVFIGCTGLTSITIPSSVASIGESAFYNCSGLTSITIPDSLTSISGSAFGGCSELTSITIPDSVTSIGKGAFSGCSGLTSITIPDSVTSIGDYAFYYCSKLTSVTIPDSVKSIGDSAFTGIPVVYYDGNATGSPWGAGKVVQSGLYDENDNLLCTWEESGIDVETNYTSSTYNASTTSPYYVITKNYPITKKIVIPDSVTSIGNCAFINCARLTSITIPDSVTSIGNAAFGGCLDLTSITIPDGVTSIGQSAFGGCSGLTSVTFENSTGWYVGSSAGTKTKAISNADLANTSTAATYLTSTYRIGYWTHE